MVPITCQSRVHLIHSYITVLVSLFLLIVFIDPTITHGASIRHITEQDVCDNDTKFSTLKNFCPNNETTLNLSNLSKKSISCILNMTLDFCVDAFPLGFLLSSIDRTKVDDLPSECTMYIPHNLSCEDIDNIRSNDATIQGYHEAFVDVLERSEFNLQAHDQASSKNHSAECQKAYKDWLCSSTKLEYRFNDTELKGCECTSKEVCLRCPSFKPDNTYGGFMAFQCNQVGEIDNGCEASDCQPKCEASDCPTKCISPTDCQPKCISRKRLRNFVYGGDNG